MVRLAAWCVFLGGMVIPLVGMVLPAAACRLRGSESDLRLLAAAFAASALVLLIGSAAGIRAWTLRRRTLISIAAGTLSIAGLLAAGGTAAFGLSRTVEYEARGADAKAVQTGAGRIRFDPETPPQLDEGLVPVHFVWRWFGHELESQAGYADATGSLVIPPIFLATFPFEDGLGNVFLDGYLSGYIDARGSWVIPPIYESLFIFTEGKVAAKWEGRWGFLDRENRWVVQPHYEEVAFFWEGLARIRIGGKWGYINSQDQIVIEPSFLRAGHFRDGRAEVTLPDGAEAVIDPCGAVLARG